MSNNPDPIYQLYADLDFSDAKPVAEVPALARRQAQRATTSTLTIEVDTALLSTIKARADDSGQHCRLLINEALRRLVAGETLAQVVRSTIREGLRQGRVEYR